MKLILILIGSEFRLFFESLGSVFRLGLTAVLETSLPMGSWFSLFLLDAALGSLLTKKPPIVPAGVHVTAISVTSSSPVEVKYCRKASACFLALRLSSDVLEL